MAVAYVSSPSIVTNDFGGAGGTHTATVPASLGSGDLWTVAMVIDSNPNEGIPSTPSGWTKHYQERCGGTGTPGYPMIVLFSKIAVGTEGNQAFTIGSGAYQMHSQSSRWTGADSTSPIGTAVVTTYYTASTSVGITAHDPTNLIVQNAGSIAVDHLGAQRYGGGASTAVMPSDMTQIYSRGGGGAGIYDKGGLSYLARDAGTYSPNDVTFSTDVMNVVNALFEIVPQGTGTGTGTGVSSVRVDRGRTLIRGLGRGMS